MTEQVKYKRAWLEGVKSLLSSDYFPVFTAVVSIVCYYLGADLINIYVFGAVIIAMILLLDDLTPVFSQTLFLAVIASKENSPMYGGSNYYLVTSNLVQIICIISLIVIAAVYRFIKQAQAKKVHMSAVFAGFIILSAVFVLNGLTSSEHGTNDLVYGAILAASILPIFALMSCSVNVTEKNIKKVCVAFFIFSVLLVIELFVALLQTDVTIKTLSFNYIRDAMKFGWGMWNNMGMLLVICIAPVMYLSLKNRGGAFFVVWATIICISVVLSTSRQSYIGAAVAYGISVVYMLTKSRGRKSNYVAFGVMAAVCIVLVGLFVYFYRDELFNIIRFGMFDEDGKYTANGRLDLIRLAWENFLKSPVFGVGFYAENMTEAYPTSMAWFPRFYHNTIAQIIGSCGIIGIVAYLFHRISCIVAFFKTRSTGKWFLGISMLVYLILGLFDNHMFYILSGFIYPALTVFLVNPVENDENAAMDLSDKKRCKFTEYRVGADAFLDGLTDEERKEFFALFIEGGSTKMPVKDYVIGGDNRRFFKDCFVNLGAVSCVSDGLMKKINLAAQQYDVK